MKTQITITYFNGESESFTASTPEFVKWERKTGLKVTQLGENVGLDDLLFLAYNAKRRENPSAAIQAIRSLVRYGGRYSIRGDR